MNYYQDKKSKEFEEFTSGKENYIVLEDDLDLFSKGGRVSLNIALKDNLKPCSFYRIGGECNDYHDMYVNDDLKAEMLIVMILNKNEYYVAGDEELLYITANGDVLEYGKEDVLIEDKVCVYSSNNNKFILFDERDWSAKVLQESIVYDFEDGRHYGFNSNGTFMISSNKVEVIDVVYK